jgi:hypothetical protein
MRRRCFSGLSALSLVVAMGVLAVWVRSYWKSDEIEGKWRLQGEWRGAWLNSDQGVVLWHYAKGLNETSDEMSGRRWKWEVKRAGGDPSYGSVISLEPWLGFEVLQVEKRIKIVSAPHWFLAGCFLVLPVRWVMVRWRRRREGCCARCGYDLRGTPDYCPECGEGVQVERMRNVKT